MLRKIFFALLFWSFFAQPPETFADWSSCASDLDSLRSKSSYASDSAEQLDSSEDELQNCRINPEIFDLLEDGCSRQINDYNTALQDLESNLDDVSRAIKFVAASCSG